MGVPAVNIELKDGPDLSRSRAALPPPRTILSGSCDYGAAELLLQHLYPHAKPGAAHSSRAGRIIGFDQTEFFDERDASTSLNETAYR
jgi:hypothetical protein